MHHENEPENLILKRVPNPGNRTPNRDLQNTLLSHMRPRAANCDVRLIQRYPEKWIPLLRTDTPHGMPSGGSAYLNTVEDYDTNKSSASPLRGAESNGRLCEWPRLRARSTSGTPGLEFCDRDRHLRTRAERIFRPIRPILPTPRGAPLEKHRLVAPPPTVRCNPVLSFGNAG